jgi:hypothetical protein
MMVMDQIPRRTRHGRGTPFLTDPEKYECGKCGRLGHNSRTCHWHISEVQLFIPLVMHVSTYASNCVSYLYISKFMFHCILNFFFIDLFFVGWRNSTCSTRRMRRPTRMSHSGGAGNNLYVFKFL